MMKRTFLLTALFVAVVFLVDVPNVLAQSAADKGVNLPDQSQREVTPGQPGDIKRDLDRENQQMRAADNAVINERNQSQKDVKTGQQGEAKKDREMTQKIRRAVDANKSLSTNTKDVKITTEGGMVTLKGPVSSEEEKSAIEEIAVGLVGKTNVKNEMVITPKSANK